MSDAPVWTKADLHAGLCDFCDVGNPKPGDSDHTQPGDDIPEAVPALPDMSAMTDAEIAQTAVRLLRQATIEVFHKMGGQDWLYQLARSDPKSFLKMLQRLLPQSIEATVTVQPFDVPASIRALSLDDLKAMRINPPAGQSQVIDVPFTMKPART